MLLLRLPHKGVAVYGCAIADGANLSDERATVARLIDEAFGGQSLCLEHAQSGAPYVPGRPESVSVTHCRGLAALAVCAGGGKVGIDAESFCRGAQLRRVAVKFLSEGQLPHWQATDASLLRAWTIKESLYKGAGIPGLPLKEIPLPEACAGNMERCTVCLRGKSFCLYDVDVPWFDGLVTLAAEI